MHVVRLTLAPVLAAAVACGPLPAEPRAPAGAATTSRAPEPAWQMLVAARDLDGQAVGAVANQATIAIVFASWCGHCRRELDELARLRGRDDVRFLGVNVRHQEEYDARGDATAVRAYIAASAPWLTVVPADVALWRALGAPPKVPTIYVFDGSGALVAVYDRRMRPMPDAGELTALLDQIAAPPGAR